MTHSKLQFRVITEGLKFPEGPIAIADGSVLVVEIEGGRLIRVLPDGTKQVVAELGGGPNGAAIGPDGNCYVCNNGGFNWIHHADGYARPHGRADSYEQGGIQRVDLASGAVEWLYTHFDGNPIMGPNDIVFDADGGFWFTDHGKQDFAARCHDIVGIFYGKADGSHLEEVIFPSNNPNGIGLSPDGKTLYAAETYTCRLVKFNIIAPGKVDDASGPGGAGVPLYRPAGWKFFDSLGMEACGNICVATIGESGISVVSPEGELVEFVATDDLFTTNICFGGADMMDAWITCSSTGRLVKTRWARPGLRLEY